MAAGFLIPGASKGGVMLTRGFHLIVIALTVSAALAAGCAKRPATTQAAAPAPTGVAGSTGTAAPPLPLATQPSAPPATAAPQTPSSTARPSPKEFVSIPELKDIHFDFDKYDIRPGDARTLDANAAWLKSNADQLVLIEGHCDERGTNEYNLALGERRAKATMNYLVSQGVQANRVTIISYGEERPVCTEHNEACWSKNRRAHFLVKPR
jgi:peptidoglycan-associated lipoprotein